MSEHRPPRTLMLLPQRFAVCRFAPDSPLPAWVFHESATVWSLTRTPRELSLVCRRTTCRRRSRPPEQRRLARIRDRRAYFLGVTGVVSALTTPLAAAGIPVFVISTYDTDLVLVREVQLKAAIATPTGAGHRVIEPI